MLFFLSEEDSSSGDNGGVNSLSKKARSKRGMTVLPVLLYLNFIKSVNT